MEEGQLRVRVVVNASSGNTWPTQKKAGHRLKEIGFRPDLLVGGPRGGRGKPRGPVPSGQVCFHRAARVLLVCVLIIRNAAAHIRVMSTDEWIACGVTPVLPVRVQAAVRQWARPAVAASREGGGGFRGDPRMLDRSLQGQPLRHVVPLPPI